MQKMLSDFQQELSIAGFDKRKIRGIVTRANNAGIDIYYAYHEDNSDTWRYRWSTSDYENNDTDILIYQATELIVKKKPGIAFVKAQTYTAECMIMIFCPINTLMKDPVLSEKKIFSVKREAEKFATADYAMSVDYYNCWQTWNNLPEENKKRIEQLRNEIEENFGLPGSRIIRSEKERQIIELGGNKPVTCEWKQKILNEFDSVEKYIEFKKIERVNHLLESLKVEIEKTY